MYRYCRYTVYILQIFCVDIVDILCRYCRYCCRDAGDNDTARPRPELTRTRPAAAPSPTYFVLQVRKTKFSGNIHRGYVIASYYLSRSDFKINLLNKFNRFEKFFSAPVSNFSQHKADAAWCVRLQRGECCQEVVLLLSHWCRGVPVSRQPYLVQGKILEL